MKIKQFQLLIATSCVAIICTFSQDAQAQTMPGVPNLSNLSSMSLGSILGGVVSGIQAVSGANKNTSTQESNNVQSALGNAAVSAGSDEKNMISGQLAQGERVNQSLGDVGQSIKSGFSNLGNLTKAIGQIGQSGVDLAKSSLHNASIKTLPEQIIANQINASKELELESAGVDGKTQAVNTFAVSFNAYTNALQSVAKNKNFNSQEIIDGMQKVKENLNTQQTAAVVEFAKNNSISLKTSEFEQVFSSIVKTQEQSNTVADNASLNPAQSAQLDSQNTNTASGVDIQSKINAQRLASEVIKNFLPGLKLK